ncbi:MULTISPECIES: hypothetical protein [Acinetobacter calcoaceticus/baumannii complex]|uniref:hypothetical protein n=1 Tax=Acinetobacter calcoaceticus/baumannii complex TaxID=909768 RepID=UPI00197FC731|nr:MULTISPECIES: hypothetical protein [Acinetobacter calcoaceticus/baumannii complex]MBN6524809.1 hypothetical protein [Acinetobacter pittii]MDH2522809.1 hypothetical protein [Acinetobacter baumannii]
MLTQSQRIQSQAIAAIAQMPYSPTTCINSIVHGCQQVLKITSIYSLQADEDGHKRMCLNQSGHKLASNIPIIKDSPFMNGRMMHAKMHPFLETISCFFNQSGFLYIPPNQELNQDFILNSIQYLNNSLLTREYDQQLNQWNEQFDEGEQKFDQFKKGLNKAVKGYDISEVVCIYPLNPHLFCNVAFSSQSDFAESMDKEITRLICQSTENAVCGVLVKRELTIHHQLVHRYLIFTECQYIDDPSSFTNLGFMEEVKHLIEPNSQNRVGLTPNHLNGFLLSNRFLKKSSDFKEQMKRLKAYVVSTDQFIRVGGTQPTFDILFSKAQKD